MSMSTNLACLFTHTDFTRLLRCVSCAFPRLQLGGTSLINFHAGRRHVLSLSMALHTHDPLDGRKQPAVHPTGVLHLPDTAAERPLEWDPTWGLRPTSTDATSAPKPHHPLTPHIYIS